MKRYFILVLATVLSLCIFSGCGEQTESMNSQPTEPISSQASEDFMSDEEILTAVEPYLEDLVFQNPENYPSMNDFLKANLNLDESSVKAADLYMGAPNRNTGFFLMLTPVENADLEAISKRLEQKGEAMVETAAQGYTEGYAEYSIIESQGRIFLVMQPDADRYNELVSLLSDM